MSSVLITGGAGFIGLHLGRAFAGLGWEVVALDNLSPQVHLDAGASRAKVSGRLVEGDVLDPAVWNALPSVDAVVHLAAETGVGQSMYEVERYRSVNVDGTARGGVRRRDGRAAGVLQLAGDLRTGPVLLRRARHDVR